MYKIMIREREIRRDAESKRCLANSFLHFKGTIAEKT